MRLVFTLAILIILGVFGFKYYNKPKDLVIIYPQETPTKIRPQEPGGLVVPNSANVIYENLKAAKTGSSTKNVNVINGPEQPLEIATTDSATDPLGDIMDQAMNKNVDTNALEDNISKIENELQLEGKEKISTTLNVVKVDTSNKISTDKKSRKKINSYKVFLASVKTEAQGNKELANIKKKYAKILKHSELWLEKIQHKDGKFFYTVVAGQYPTISKAKAICKDLIQHQQSCIVSNPN